LQKKIIGSSITGQQNEYFAKEWFITEEKQMEQHFSVSFKMLHAKQPWSTVAYYF